MPTNSYATLTDVKAWLHLDANSSSDDPLLERLIGAASQYIDTYIGRNIMSQTVTETRNGHGGTGIAPRNTPITNVSSLSLDTFSVNSRNVDQSSGFSWSDTMIYAGGCFSRGTQNVTYTYTAGYQFVPADIAQACIELVGFKYRARERIGVVSHSQDRVVTDSFITSDVPPEVRETMDRYKRVTM